MITVWFATGDLAASARFDADQWGIDNLGRLSLSKTVGFGLPPTWIAEFQKHVWLYVAKTEAEVEIEE